ncbi:MAG: ATP-binding protein [Patescibacteria group bacterium]
MIKFNLQFKLLISVVFIVLFSLFCFGYLSIRNQKTLAEDLFLDSAIALLQTLDAGITNRADLEDVEKLQTKVHKIIWLNPNITNITISLPIDEELIIVASSNVTKIGLPASLEEVSSYRTGELFTKILSAQDESQLLKVVTPVHVSGQKVGVYGLTLSLDTLERNVKNISFQFSVGILLTTIFIVVVLSIVIRTAVISPVKKLQEGIEIIGSGNLDHIISIHKNDEMGDLSIGFNNMTEKLKDRTEALAREKSSLEGKIKKRTSELESIRFEESEEMKKTSGALLNMLEDTDNAKEQTEKERDKTLAIITNFTDGLMVFNNQDELSLINAEAEKIFNIEAKNVINQSLGDLKNESSFNLLAKIIGRSWNSIFREELNIREDLVLEVSVINILGEKEEGGHLVILHNITREKRIEKMKTEFVSIAAHQLRTPLSAIKWTLRMFLDGDLGKVSKEQKGFLEKTYQSNERMISLINDLLNVSRIEEGRYVYRLDTVDIAKMTQILINAQKVNAEKRGIQLEYDMPKKKSPKIKVDEEKIGLAIQNLIDNAIRYTPKGGKVSVFLKNKKEGLEISVKDSGIGIPEDQQKRIFTKFFRATNAMKIDTEGSGLGLFIVKNIIDAHKGKVSFKSEKNKGTIFSIVLPKEK